MNKYLEKIKKEINLIKSLLRSRSASNGMTYIELIVVLSIFAIMSSIAVFNYGTFQGKVDIKNLGSDVALKIVEAQKASFSGLLPAVYPLNWKPSYGVYFDTTSSSEKSKFIYFVNFNDDVYNSSTDIPNTTISITKNNFVSKLEAIGCASPEVNSLSVVFRRPDSRAIITSFPPSSACISYAQITVSSPKLITALIKIYPSGRIQIN